MGLTLDEKVIREVQLKEIKDVAAKFGIPSKMLKLYGKYIAKVPAELLNRGKGKNSKLILMTSITPTIFGEGKTVNTVGLSMALNKLGKKSIACIGQSNMGQTFGVKGISTGGGNAQVVPAEEINLNFTGDFGIVANAQNLCAAAIDNSFFWGNTYLLAKDNVTWKRVMEFSDRALINITIGGGGKQHGVSRKT
ncbi:MAG: formate--tetrahydrofolate ligase, partial [Candidatus Omnitrophica bacterium]|nr:formate--tetrahydrofolate ligase [Candidatus Omnitrophota bacterium]